MDRFPRSAGDDPLDPVLELTGHERRIPHRDPDHDEEDEPGEPREHEVLVLVHPVDDRIVREVIVEDDDPVREVRLAAFGFGVLGAGVLAGSRLAMRGRGGLALRRGLRIGRSGRLRGIVLRENDRLRLVVRSMAQSGNREEREDEKGRGKLSGIPGGSRRLWCSPRQRRGRISRSPHE